MMELDPVQTAIDCPWDEISSYIDGELTPMRELQLERHFAACESCLGEVNLQKKFLIALDRALESEAEIDLPANFTEIVVANAESGVSGLRRRSERSNAFFVCAGLFLIIIFALGASGSRTALDAFFIVFEKAAAVGSFAVHVAYDIAVGAVVILRSLSSHIIEGSALSLLLPGAAAVYLYIVARLAMLLGRR